jgi:hypothetical protein
MHAHTGNQDEGQFHNAHAEMRPLRRTRGSVSFSDDAQVLLFFDASLLLSCGVCVPPLLVVTMCYAVLWHRKVARHMLPGARKGQHWIDKSESKAAAPSSSS